MIEVSVTGKASATTFRWVVSVHSIPSRTPPGGRAGKRSGIRLPISSLRVLLRLALRAESWPLGLSVPVQTVPRAAATESGDTGCPLSSASSESSATDTV